MKRLRIAHVVTEAEFVRGEDQVLSLIEGLHELGHDGVVLCPPGSRIDADARRRGFPVHAVDMRSEADLDASAELALELLNCRPDVVHCHTDCAAWFGVLAAQILSLPAVATRHVDEPIRSGGRQRLVYGSLVARVVAASYAVQESLLAGGVAFEKIVLIRGAIPAPRAGTDALVAAQMVAAYEELYRTVLEERGELAAAVGSMEKLRSVP